MKGMYTNVPVFSQLFLVAAGMCFILNIFGHSIAYNLFALTPAAITQNFEFWRLLTYPLATTSTESFLLLTISVGLFSSLLELSFSTRRFILSILGLVISQGLLYVVAFGGVSKGVVLSGGDGISFFLMAMYTFVMPNRSIHVWRRIEIRGLFVVMVLALTSFFFSAYRAYHDTSDLFYYGAISSAYGVVFAVLLTSVLHQRLKRVRRLNGRIAPERIDERFVEQEEELVSTFGKSDRGVSKLYYPEAHRDEEELMNQLLDKIFEHGQDSLTPEEKSFLEDYSQRMR